MGWMMGSGWNGAGWNGGGAWGVVNGLLSVVFLVAVIIGVILVARYLLTSPPRRPGEWPSAPPQPGWTDQGSSALRILEDRYARGEIESQEFLQRKQDLQS